MKDTITITALIQQLQSKLSDNINPEQFIEAFTATVLEGLAKDGNVTIKGFGKFIILPHDNEGGESHISKDDIRFIPDNELAETINQPFAFFDAVELDDDVTDEVLEKTDDVVSEPANDEDSKNETTADEDASTSETEVTEQVSTNEVTTTDETVVITEADNSEESVTETDTETKAENEDTTITSAPQPISPTSDADVKTSENEPVQNESDTKNTVNENITPDESEEEHSSDKSWIWLIVFFIIGLAIGWSVPTFITNNSTPEEIVLHDTIYIEKTVKQEVVKDSLKADKIENPAPQQSKIVTDTVRANRFLTQMARKYYGNPEFWAYIYIENQDKLKNPNTIAPGTVVVIPPAEKYGINSKSKESVNTATRKCQEILNKYEKK